MAQCKYFIAYKANDGVFGNIGITRDGPILSYDDIIELTKFLENYKGLHTVVITNFILFDDKGA